MEGWRGEWCEWEQQQIEERCGMFASACVVESEHSVRLWGYCVYHVSGREWVCGILCVCVCVYFGEPAGADTQGDRLCEGSSLHLCSLHPLLLQHHLLHLNTLLSGLYCVYFTSLSFPMAANVSLSLALLTPLGENSIDLETTGFCLVFPLLGSKQSYKYLQTKCEYFIMKQR